MRTRLLSSYRKRRLPTIKTKKMLEGDELCHYESRIVYKWLTPGMQSRGEELRKQAQGELIFTNKRVIFISDAKNFEYSPVKIIDVEKISGTLAIKCSVQNGGGIYFPPDVDELEAILIGVARKHKFHVDADFSSSMSRHIPQHVKKEVMNRDNGRCVTCGAIDYLEFDHIIAHSKGGASAMNNIQLLCRRCNNLKRDRL